MTPAKPYSILVVDGETDLAALMRQRMRPGIRDRRYEFVFAGNGIEALEQLRQRISNVAPKVRSVMVTAFGDINDIRTGALLGDKCTPQDPSRGRIRSDCSRARYTGRGHGRMCALITAISFEMAARPACGEGLLGV
jgi:hypothetical protein